MGSTRRPALAVARPRPAAAAAARSPASGAGGRSRLRRVPVLAVASLAVAGLLYLGATKTPVFELDAIAVTGVPAKIAGEVERALRPYRGESLVALDADALRTRVERLPWVRTANVDRDFPGTLRVAVVPERPVAVLRHGAGAWLVAGTGVVLEQVGPADRRGLPRVWLGARAARPVAGRIVDTGQGALAVRGLAAVPSSFPAEIVSAGGSERGVILVLGGSHAEVRLGEPVDLGVKVAAAAAVLDRLSATDRLDLAYVDVSLPDRAVVSVNSQVKASG